MTTKLPTSIYLETLEWVDKTYGNTYFASRIYADGELITVLPFQYGYGSHDKAEALKALEPLFEIPKDVTALWQLKEYGVSVYDSKKTARLAETKNHGKIY